MSSFEEQETAALRQRVVRLEAQVDLLYRHLGITYSEEGTATDDPQIIAALRAHKMIEAIQIYRQKTGVGLAEAKSVMEALRAGLGL